MPHQVEVWATRFKARFLSGRPPWVTAVLRRLYVVGLEILTLSKGVPRRVSDLDTIHVSPALRQLGEDYEKEALAYLRDHVRSGDVVFDVGAHAGVYSILLARWVGHAGKVYAFEPAPATVGLLRRHLKMNGVSDRVVVLPWAIGATAGWGTLKTRGSHVQNTLCAVAHGLTSHYESFEVQVTSIDQFCHENQVRPAWIKIDTEGWELHALRGASGLIRSHSGVRFVVEMHPYAWEGAGHGKKELVVFLREHGLEPRGLSGQRDPLDEYGQVALDPVSGA